MYTNTKTDTKLMWKRRRSLGGYQLPAGPLKILWLALFLFTPAFLKAQTNPLPLDCPTGSLILSSGTYAITTTCSFKGDIRLSGSAVLVIDHSHFQVDGSIFLSGDSQLLVRSSAFTIDNHYVLEHRIEARDRAKLEFVGAVMSTNKSLPGTSFASQYVGYDHSVFRLVNSQILLPDSWLLADFTGDSSLHTFNSINFPSELYPHDRSTILVEGQNTDHRVWLEFISGSQAMIKDLPDRNTPFSYSFGRRTPGVVNVGYQVDIAQGIVTFGIASHPGSDVTLQDNVAPVSIGYHLIDTAVAGEIQVNPGMRNATLTHQGRVLRLVNANLEPVAWQIYTRNPSNSPKVVRISNSVLNEIAALDYGQFSVSNCILQWAVIGAVGRGSSITIEGSTINSQSILALQDGFIHIASSKIYGAVIQASHNAVILLTNNFLKKNLCHSECLPLCPSFANGGCNWFNPAGADPRYEVKDNAKIAALGIDPLSGPISIGGSHAFIGDAFIEVAPGATISYTYNLRYRNGTTGQQGVLVTGGLGPKRGAVLGALATAGLPAGDYDLILELMVGNNPAGVVTRPFRLTTP